MTTLLRRGLPLAALCLAVFLGGCVVVPERHREAVYVPGLWWHR